MQQKGRCKDAIRSSAIAGVILLVLGGFIQVHFIKPAQEERQRHTPTEKVEKAEPKEEVTPQPAQPQVEELPAPRVQALPAVAQPVVIESADAVNALAREFIETQSSGGGDTGFHKLHYPVSFFDEGVQDRAYVMNDREVYSLLYPKRYFVCEQVLSQRNASSGEWAVVAHYRCALQSFEGQWLGYRMRCNYVVRNYPGEGLRIASLLETREGSYKPSAQDISNASEAARKAPSLTNGAVTYRAADAEALVREFIETQSSDGNDLGFSKLHYPVLLFEEGKAIGLKDRSFVMRERQDYARKFPTRRFVCHQLSSDGGGRQGEWRVSAQYQCELQKPSGKVLGYHLKGYFVVRELPGEGLRICSFEEVIKEKYTPMWYNRL